jgi:hypothetical protein
MFDFTQSNAINKFVECLMETIVFPYAKLVNFYSKILRP